MRTGRNCNGKFHCHFSHRHLGSRGCKIGKSSFQNKKRKEDNWITRVWNSFNGFSHLRLSTVMTRFNGRGSWSWWWWWWTSSIVLSLDIFTHGRPWRIRLRNFPHTQKRRVLPKENRTTVFKNRFDFLYSCRSSLLCFRLLPQEQGVVDDHSGAEYLISGCADSAIQLAEMTKTV